VEIGSQVGNVLVLSVGGLMCSWDFAGGWPLLFYSTSKLLKLKFQIPFFSTIVVKVSLV